MSGSSEDAGLTTTQLFRLAWVLGLAAVVSCGVLGRHAADHDRVQSVQLVWLAVGVVAAVFSGCCAVLVGVRSAEARLSSSPAPPSAAQSPVSRRSQPE